MRSSECPWRRTCDTEHRFVDVPVCSCCFDIQVIGFRVEDLLQLFELTVRVIASTEPNPPYWSDLRMNVR